MNRQFASCLKPLFQSEAKWKIIYMKTIFCSQANITHFQKKGINIEDFSSGALAPAPAWISGDFSELILVFEFSFSFNIDIQSWVCMLVDGQISSKSPMQSLKSGVLVFKFRPHSPLEFQELSG